MTLALAASSSDLHEGEDDSSLVGFTDWLEGQGGQRIARSRLRLSGMHCAACAGLIESLLSRQPGVLKASVSGATQRLSLQWQPESTRLDRLRQVLRVAGYDLAPDLAAPAQALRRQEHRQALWRLFVAGFLMMQVMMLAWPGYVAADGEMEPDLQALLRWGQWVMTLPVMLMAAGPFFRAAWQQIRQRSLGMDVPVALGLGVAFMAGTGATLDPGGPFGHEVYFDSITMFLAFLLGGRYLELRARHRAAEALEQAGESLPERVERLTANGGTESVAPQQLRPGDQLRVAAGQAFAADAVVELGESAADESLLSGESRPVPKRPGDAVLAGSLNLQGLLQVRVTRAGEDTRMAAIQQLMRQAFDQRPGLLRVADRVARVFLVAVLLLAGAAAVAWQFIDPSRALAVSVAVLIVTCPCALSLAAPSAWVAAAGQLARRGLLLGRLDALESLAEVNHVLLDKTGTLTEARLTLQSQSPAELPSEAQAWAHALASASHHPLSRALLAALPEPAAPVQPGTVDELPGHGMQALDAQGRRWRLGAPAWVADRLVPAHVQGPAQLALACDGELQASWCFDEQLREDAAATVQAWRERGLQVELLSGDLPDRVRAMAERAGIAQWRGGVSPEGKLARMTELQAAGHKVLMLGDGLNDAPVLARAHVAVAMGQGADLAKARADALLMNGRLAVLADALPLARRTRRVVRQNLAWAAAYNAACVPLALVGWLPPWAAGLGMALSSAFVIANAARLGRA